MSPPSSTRRAEGITAWCSTLWCGSPHELVCMDQAGDCSVDMLQPCTGRVVEHRLRRVHRHHLWHLQARGGV